MLLISRDLQVSTSLVGFIALQVDRLELGNEASVEPVTCWHGHGCGVVKSSIGEQPSSSR